MIARQALENKIADGGTGFRDRAMAENLEWILAIEPPGTKVVVWAHNAHVSRVDRRGNAPMGWHLERALGSDYVVFGFAFNQGSFQAIDSTWGPGRPGPGGLKEHTVAPAPEESVEAALAQAGAPVFALDLRSRPGRTVPAWFSVAHPMRQIGSLFFGEPAMSTPIVLTDEYDALLFVERTTRAIPLERRP